MIHQTENQAYFFLLMLINLMYLDLHPMQTGIEKYTKYSMIAMSGIWTYKDIPYHQYLWVLYISKDASW